MEGEGKWDSASYAVEEGSGIGVRGVGKVLSSKVLEHLENSSEVWESRVSWGCESMKLSSDLGFVVESEDVFIIVFLLL